MCYLKQCKVTANKRKDKKNRIFLISEGINKLEIFVSFI
jgi:hypothetical protein